MRIHRCREIAATLADCVTATSGNVAGSGYYWFQVRLAEGGYGWMRSDLVANPGNR